MNIKKEKLLKELEKLNYGERIKQLSLLGFNEKENPDLGKLLDELEKGNVFEYSLSLFIAVTSGDKERLIKGLRNESTYIRNISLSGLFRVLENEDVIEIESLPINTRRKLLKYTAFYKKTGLAEKLIPHVLEKYGYKEGSILLPVCKEETFKKYLPIIGPEIKNWKRIAQSQPDIFLDYVKEQFIVSPERDYSLIWAKFEHGLQRIITLKYREILEMAIKYLPGNELPYLIINNSRYLTEKEPDLLFSLLTGSSYKPTLILTGRPLRKISSSIRHFGKDRIIAIGKIIRDSHYELAYLLDSLAPSSREEIFLKIFEDINTETHIWPLELLKVLPHGLRHKEATRMLNLREIKDSHEKTLEITSYCDIETVREILYKAVSVPKADERATAMKHLINSTGLYRKGLGETLKYLGRIKNEQDPVRLAVLESLSRIKPSVFKEEHMEEINNLSDFIFNARDTSSDTRYALQNLAMSILFYNIKNSEGKLFNFALNILEKIAHQSAHIPLPHLESILPAGLENKIFNAMLPVLAKGNRKEHYGLIIDLATVFGKKGWYIKELQDMLEEAIDGKPDYYASMAIDLWLTPPKTRDERVIKLINKDKSVITNNKVFNHIHRKKQEYLDFYLTGKTIKGKFLTGKTFYLIPAVSGFYRWLPRQEKAFGKLLHRIGKDKKEFIWERTRAIRKLPLLTNIEPSEIAYYLKDEDINIVEAALFALSHVDNPEKTLPILLENLDSDRARVAMYSIPRAIKFIPPGKINLLLKSLLGGKKLKVTVHKEIVRILGSNRIDDDCSILSQEWEKDLHRDVRIAVIHGVRQLLDREEAWHILKKASETDDSNILESLLEQPSSCLNAENKERYVELILKIAENENIKTRKKSFLALMNWTSGSEKVIIRKAGERIISTKDSPEWKEAVNLIIRSCQDGEGTEEVLDVIKHLTIPLKDQIKGTQERDIPERQRLIHIMEALARLPYNNRRKLKNLFKETARIFSDDITLWNCRALMQIASMSWDNHIEDCGIILNLISEIKEKPYFLNYIIGNLLRYLNDTTIDFNEEILLLILDNLCICWENEQLLAVNMLKILGPKYKWQEKYLKRLEILREAEWETVRTEAYRVFTAME